MALIPSQVLRVAILLSYFSILCHYKALDMPAHQTYGGSWKFLTFIDLVRFHLHLVLTRHRADLLSELQSCRASETRFSDHSAFQPHCACLVDLHIIHVSLEEVKLLYLTLKSVYMCHL